MAAILIPNKTDLAREKTNKAYPFEAKKIGSGPRSAFLGKDGRGLVGPIKSKMIALRKKLNLEQNPSVEFTEKYLEDHPNALDGEDIDDGCYHPPKQ